MRIKVLLIIGIWIACCRGSEQNEVLEIVVYKIKPENLNSYIQRLDELHKLMTKFKGFKSIETFQSQESGLQFVDHCTWETLGEAQDAAREVGALKEFQVFFAMMDTVIYFDHIKPLD